MASNYNINGIDVNVNADNANITVTGGVLINGVQVAGPTPNNEPSFKIFYPSTASSGPKMQEVSLPPPPPPPAAAQLPPPPRRALHDASSRANQSPLMLPPILDKRCVGNRSLENDDWREELVEVRKEADSLRSMYQDIANDDLKIAKSPQDKRTSLVRSAISSDEYSHERPLEKTSVDGMTKAADERLGAAAAKTKTATAKPAASSPGNGRKRKSETTLDEDIAAYKQDLSQIDVDDMYVDLTCNQVRSRINKVIDSGIMKKGEFCTTIGSSNNSVNTFLKKSGSMDGAHSDAYTNAWAWFKQRELAGLKMPDVKKRQQAEAARAAAAAPTVDTTAAGPATKKVKTAVASSATTDLSEIHLRGEETDSVLIFDSCDEIRKKIAAHLKMPGLTQAQFCRDLYAQLKAPTCKGIQTKQLNDFRGKKGAIAGCTSSVFYAAYVYFEKLRTAKDKPKSAHRLEMEKIYPGEGIGRDSDGRNGFWVLGGERPYMDQYGRLRTM